MANIYLADHRADIRPAIRFRMNLTIHIIISNINYQTTYSFDTRIIAYL